MSKVKELLKEAKIELAREDYEEAVKLSKEVLSLDSDNYFAHVFLGKSFSCLKDGSNDAFNHYKLAIEIAPDNLLAWKGLFLFLKSQASMPEVVSFDDFFDLCSKYAKILLEQELSQVELIHDIRVFQKKHPECKESFLRHMIPGTPMAEQLAHHLISPQDALKGLIEILAAKQSGQISKLVSRERLKLSANHPDYQIKINGLAWEIYKDSQLDLLYNQLVNITDDDDKRADLEIEWLEYRIKVLKSMPQDLKVLFFEKVKTMVEDMVLVDHKSLMAWKLYFEWQDCNDLDDMNQEQILKFFKKFPIEPLAAILYAWASSQFSGYDMKASKMEAELRINQEESRELTDIDEGEQHALIEMMEKENDATGLLEEEVLDALLDNISRAQNSVLANRIITQYYILSREYEAALPYVKAGISLVAYKIRDFGGQFLNSKREFTLNLAILYTYIDAPKNHTAALSLFEKVLKDNPQNTRAKLGKGLIFMEREDWTRANLLLVEVAGQFPDNLEVLSELGWNEAQLGNLDDAIALFSKVLNSLEGTDLRTTEFRALNMWRKANVYILIHEQEATEDRKYITLAFKELIHSIKDLDTYAPSYSTLGEIYCKYYSDNIRAFKCFYKAFELDAGDITAAKYMVEKYAAMSNWQAARTIAERLVASEKARRKLQEVNWAYRVIGIYHLEEQQEADSIEWFQSALRVDSKDIESWIGLGQAYYACGRIEASIKVFERAIELDPQHLYSKYLKAQSLSVMGEYQESIKILESITTLSAREEIFQVSLASVLVDFAVDLYSQGLLIKSVVTATRVISILQYTMNELSYHGQNLWMLLSKALKLFILVESKVDDLPVESLVSIFQSTGIMHATREIDDLDGLHLANLLSGTDDTNISITCKFFILSSKYAISTTPFNDMSTTVRSSLWYNIGIAELTAYHILKEEKYRTAAILAFKKSIQYQSNTPESWIGLGIATMDVNYRVAQHCFIKATALAPKQTEIWFNLAILGLKNNDIDFTREVLNRSRSISPQESSPWLGIALTLEREGKVLESSQMYGHAFVLSNGRSKIAQLLYAKSVLQNRVGSSDDERDVEAVEELTAAACGLDQYFKKNPDDPFALQCALLIMERLHNFSYAHDYGTKLAQFLEMRFEHTQNNSELYNFAIVKAQIARVQLGSGKYTSAIENAELSQNILADFCNDDNDVAMTCISNHISLGLAQFFSDNFEETLVHLEELLRLSKSSRHLMILTAKILYKVGSDDSRQIALEELMEYISANGADLLVNLAIAAICIVEAKQEDLRAILCELKRISLADLIADKHRDVPYLIEQIVDLLQPIEKAKSKNPWQKSAFFFMNDHKAWSNENVQMKQRISSGGQNKVTAQQLSCSYCSSKNLGNIQKSIFLSPWNCKAISALKQCF